MPSRGLAAAVFLLLTLIWGTTWAAIRFSLVGIPPFLGVSLRFALAALLLLVAVPLLRVRLGALPAERWLWLVNGATTFVGSYGIVYWAEQWVPSGLAAVLFATFPLFVALLAHLVLPQERLSLRAALGILLGLGGVATIFSEDFAHLGGREVLLPALVFLLAPLLSAFGYVAIKRWGKGVHPVSLSLVPMALTAVVMGGVGWRLEGFASLKPIPSAWAALVYLAVFGSAVSFSLYFWLLSHFSATRLSLIGYTVPIVAMVVGAGFLDEPFTLKALAGSGLVLVGVALAAQARKSV